MTWAPIGTVWVGLGHVLAALGTFMDCLTAPLGHFAAPGSPCMTPSDTLGPLYGVLRVALEGRRRKRWSKESVSARVKLWKTWFWRHRLPRPTVDGVSGEPPIEGPNALQNL